MGGARRAVDYEPENVRWGVISRVRNGDARVTAGCGKVDGGLEWDRESSPSFDGSLDDEGRGRSCRAECDIEFEKSCGCCGKGELEGIASGGGK